MNAQMAPSTSSRPAAPATVMVRPLLLKPQWMNGLSERLLVSHYENNYGGAVRRLNAIRARLAALDWAHTPTFEINGLKREELMAASSVMLHEGLFRIARRIRRQSAHWTCRTARRTRSGVRS